jgi:sugar lactone lactonase YvrE
MSRSTLGTWILIMVGCICSLAALAPAAGAHHEQGGKGPVNGRLSNQPDLQRIGDTTYRYSPARGEYEVRRQGQPISYFHGDPAYGEAAAIAGQTELPTNELDPICRTSGARIIPVYTHREKDTAPTPTALLRSVIRRINWKIADQSSQSSGGSRVVRMAVDCNAQGEISVYDLVTSSSSFSVIDQALFENLGYLDDSSDFGVKYLTFDSTPVTSGVIGLGQTWPDAIKSRSNKNAKAISTAVIYNNWWTRHTSLHELMHILGASQGAVSPAAPFSTPGAHCTDGLDLLCYDDGSGGGAYTETRCPASSGYGSPNALPVDCGNDTYFDAAPAGGSWLSSYWNIATVEDPYLSTVPGTPPGATTTQATPITTSKAILQGSVVPNGEYSSYQFEWGTTTAYGNKKPSPMQYAGYGSSPETFSQEVIGLSKETTYHYRVVAKNDAGTTYGEDKTFITSIPPKVVNSGVSEITTTGAKLTGTINPEGSITNFYFEYGPTKSYGTLAPVPSKLAGSGTTNQAVSQVIGGLSPGVTYHYRLVGVNAGGTVPGEDKTFTAKDVPPIFSSSFGTTGSGYGQFKGPYGMAIDSSGNIWVADSGNDRVQKFNSKGEYQSQFGSTGIGNGQFKRPTDIAITPGGDLWVVDAENARVQKFNSKGEYLGKFGVPGSGNGQFVEPLGIAIDKNGNIWVSDRSFSPLEQFNASGEYIRTAGGGLLGYPEGVAVDSENNVWVVDWEGNSVQKYSPTGQFVSQFGSYGTGNGQLAGPTAIEFMPSGNMLVSDSETGRVQEFSPGGEYLAQFGAGKLYMPSGIVFGSAGSVYVSSGFNRIEKWQLPVPEASTQGVSGITATQATVAGSVNPKGLPATYRFEYGTSTAYGSSAPLPEGSVSAGSESVPVSALLSGLKPQTEYHYRIVATNSVGGLAAGEDKTFKTKIQTKVFSSSFGSFGSGDGQFNSPSGMAVVKSTGDVWVVDRNNNRMEKFNSKGEYVAKFGSAGSGKGQFNLPVDVALDAASNLYVSDSQNGRVQKFNFNMESATPNQYGSYGYGNGQLIEPSGVAVDPSGNVWVADYGYSRVVEFKSNGEYIRTIWGGGEGSNEFMYATRVAIDSAGNVYVTDYATNKVLKYSPTGQYLSQFGSTGSGPGQFLGPTEIEVEPSGEILVADGPGRIQRFSASGEYMSQFSGVPSPGGLAIASGGIVYVARQSSPTRVEKWVDSGPPTATTQAATGVTSTGATLQGTVNPRGIATTYRFEYGPTTAYGTKAPAPDASAGSGVADAAVSKAISGLTAGTTYHFRVVATNAEGTTFGADQTFSTP